MNPKASTEPPGRIRIIGGEWRRRWLTIPSGSLLRPTADRVRETLFNWLGPYLPGSYCLDLFAGTGALGLEAVSRGAERAVLVENHPRIMQQLKANVSNLKTDRVEFVELDACCFIAASPSRRFDLVFLDPPFGTTLLTTVVPMITRAFLAPSALIYLESEREAPRIALPDGWRIMREGETRQTRYCLIETDI
ncbi:MAG: 16S rRNA (guanine(966)-N(2))-methyltransferase RsmD [Gammaproteobacteria bacterium]|nr:16S rRNA (guanine(966)-N(2))-methyltransferase RsmD [Gammaproteobacteria bacterium]